MISHVLIEKAMSSPPRRFLAEMHSAKLFPEPGMTRSVGHQTRVAERRPLHSGMSCPAAVQASTKYELVIIASGKSRKGGRDVATRKPFTAIQRVRHPPGKGEPASRKRALRGWWQHHSRSVGSRCLSPEVAPI